LYIFLGQPRSLSQQLEIIQSTGEHLGYANAPLTGIPFTAFLIDIPHKFLRVREFTRRTTIRRSI